jgi:hypothetical protein
MSDLGVERLESIERASRAGLMRNGIADRRVRTRAGQVSTADPAKVAGSPFTVPFRASWTRVPARPSRSSHERRPAYPAGVAAAGLSENADIAHRLLGGCSAHTAAGVLASEFDQERTKCTAANDLCSFNNLICGTEQQRWDIKAQ